MAALDSIREVLNEINTGCSAVDALGVLAAHGGANEAYHDLTAVLLYVGGKLKRDAEQLDIVLNRDCLPVLHDYEKARKTMIRSA